MSIYSLIVIFHILFPSISSLASDVVKDSKNWALLVSGSNYYENYRHQADASHAHYILMKNGIPKSQIITMMFDDIANNRENPYPGKIFNRPVGPNVYEDIVIDYSGKEVNMENFLNIISPNETLKGMDKRKVLNTSLEDNVFIYMVDHGSIDYFSFINDGITSDQLIEALNNLSTKCSSVLIFIDCCFSGSLFSKPNLRLNDNVLAITSANATSSSFACYWDDKIKAFLGDQFGVSWMENVEKLMTTRESIEQLVTVMEIETQNSQVSVFGNKEFMKYPLSKYIGHQPEFLKLKNMNKIEKNVKPKREVISSHDIQFMTYSYQFNKTHSSIHKEKLSNLLRDLLLLENVFSEFEISIKNLTSHENHKPKDFYSKSEYSCYRESIRYFSEICRNPREVNKAYSYFHHFLDACSSGATIEMIKEILKKKCLEQKAKLNY